jgi:deoxyribonuclease IV
MAAAKKELLLGAHMSTAGGIATSVERGHSIGCTAMQVFVKQNSRWAFPPLKDEDAALFRSRLKASSVKACIAHAIYLVNCASTNPDFLRKSIEDLADELSRCEKLGISGLVLHPGAHCGAGEKQGIEQIAAALNTVLAACPDGKTRILLETTAGQGSCLGHQFEHIAEIMDRVDDRKRIGVCLDTCHVFAAGFDIRTEAGYETMWKQFDRIIGRKKLCAIHLNDSKKPLGSRVDRHDHIGKGLMGLEPFRMIMNDSRLHGIPMILETEKQPDMKEDIENMRVLRSLIR